MNWSAIAYADPVIQIHLGFALLALTMGVIMWVRPKGTKSHKLIGRIFAGCMLLAAISAIFIREINHGQFSWIHFFVPLTFWGIYNAISGIRKGDVKRHKSAVKGLFFGALLIPGLFAFMPGRRLWMVFFGG